MRKSLLLLLILCSSAMLHAQIGTEFWFAVPDVNDSHADEPLSLNISTFDEPATVTVSIPSNPGFTPIVRTIAPNSFEVIALECHADSRANPPHYNCSTSPVNFKAMLETNTLNTAQDKGLHISSTENISVYYQVLGSNCNVQRCKIANGDMFALKGDNALGTEFYVCWQNGHGVVTQDFWNDALGGKQGTSLYIVATQDNTNIDITPSVDLVGGNMAGVTYSISLNRGQTYAIKSAGYTGATHLSGTRLVADKEIAVTVIDDTPADRSDFAANGNKPKVYDLAGDQLIPIDYAGTDYIVSKFYAYVTAIQNGTQVYVGGVLQTTLTAGQTYEVNLTSTSGPVFIHTTQPALLFHLRGIAGLDGYPEFGGAIVPPLNCTGSRAVRFSRATNEYMEQFFLTIVVRSNGVDDFVLNGNTSWIKASDFSPVPGNSGWMYLDKEFTTTQIPPFETSTVSNSSSVFHLGIVFGRPHIDQIAPLDSVSTGCQYGYFSNFGEAQLAVPDLSNKCLLPGEDLVVDPGGYDEYTWYYNENFISDNPTLEITESGDYALKVSDDIGCEDSVSFSVVLGHTPEFAIQQDEHLCPEETSNLSIVTGGPGDGDYEWTYAEENSSTYTLISTDESIVASDPGSYVLTISSPGCGTHSDTVRISKWDVLVPNLFTPNGDALNDYFEVGGLANGTWRLQVYNRWGGKVFASEKYNNEWNGIDDAQAEMSEGIYFFELKEESSERCNYYKGWLHLLR